MKKELGVGELVHNGLFYDKLNAFDSDIPFYKKICQSTGGKVLELCCGTGRLTIPLKEAGVDIVGLDIEDSMLNAAIRKAKDKKLNIKFIKGDMRSFDLEEKFSLIFIPFNSIQNIYKLEDVEAIFTSVKKHLEPDGKFIVEVFNPSISYMAEWTKKTGDVGEFTLDDGRKVNITQTLFYDSASQTNRVTWIHDIDGVESKQQLDMRCYYPQELDALLKYNGFELLNKYGDHDFNEFTSESKKQICICV